MSRRESTSFSQTSLPLLVEQPYYKGWFKGSVSAFAEQESEVPHLAPSTLAPCCESKRHPSELSEQLNAALSKHFHYYLDKPELGRTSGTSPSRGTQCSLTLLRGPTDLIKGCAHVRAASPTLMGLHTQKRNRYPGQEGCSFPWALL